VEVFRRGYRTLGPVFSMRLGPQRAAVMVGPEHHRFFFTQADRALSLPEVYRFVVPMFGEVLNASPHAEVRRGQLALLHTAFRGARMDGYVAAMAAETRAWIASLGASGTFELNEAFTTLGMRIAAAALVGPEVRARIEELRPLYEDLARGMEFVLPPNLPLPRFRRRDRARKKLEEMVAPLLAARRAAPGAHDDFLEKLATEGDEAALGMALLAVFTGYITTSAQAAWTLVQLLESPRWEAAVREETAEVLGHRPHSVDAPALARLSRLEWALKESQRMNPVMSHYARYVAQDIEAGGYRIPRGWLAMVCPAVAHRLPQYFAEPDTYDPGRFAPDRAEDRATPYALIPFGGGPYRCPGMAFGTHEMKCIVGMLLQHFDMELLDRAPGRDFEMGVIRPRPPCRVRYTRRAAAPHEARAVPAGAVAAPEGWPPTDTHRRVR
jgi:sterol 14-demethylase